MLDSGSKYGSRVSHLVSWGHWFSFFNIIAAMLVGVKYIVHSPLPDTWLGLFYLISSWCSHFAFLVLAFYLLILFPLTFLIPSRKVFRLITICFFTLSLVFLLIDAQAYQTINLHLSPVVWKLLFNDKNNTINSNLQNVFIILPFIFLSELILSEWIWYKKHKLFNKRIGFLIATFFFISFISSHLIYVWSDAYFYSPVTNQKTNFPLSYPMTAKSFMERHGLLNREKHLKRLAKNEIGSELIKYPLEKITFCPHSEKLNILVVNVSNLRSDRLNDSTMPATTIYSKNNLNFTNHYSSSNDIYGMFGLFYGLPSVYASSIKSQGTLPLLISTLQDQGYQFGLFSSDNFNNELYVQTIFRGLHFSSITFSNNESSDSQTINVWAKWAKDIKQPWLSFIELTTLNDLNNYKAKIADDLLRTSYNHSVNQVDSELKKLYEQLETLGFKKDTVVIITSNHGIEFNETKRNNWDSNSNYSRYQLQVPMIIHWPGKLAAKYNHRSSHLDISVTLLQDLLGVSSNPTDFSSGRSLFRKNKRKLILAGNSQELALITPRKTTVMDKFGNYKLYGPNYQRLEENPNLPILMQGLTELKRFYAM
ncbi:hypothetical protein CF67_04188 [Candidatus Photodesmus blepharus]|uniref:Uncharacterized protein n=1 Tax=Candidatus Photodesmus blepharonis TaxID=1179155 RepID=A0A084CN44_9GAMM|nr:DUF3413 domain-containing protein [Candidatus Photodesmus blepharus]KEY91223.1 hypothetical protein CF67_04188 [Candidatus Photodesmus blepharus]